jgi:hypothetical protein
MFYFQHVVVLVQSVSKKAELEKILEDSGAHTKDWIPKDFFTQLPPVLANLVFLRLSLF